MRLPHIGGVTGVEVGSPEQHLMWSLVGTDVCIAICEALTVATENRCCICSSMTHKIARIVEAMFA